MTLKLYFAPGACSFVPHTLLEVAGEPFEPVLVKLHKRENYSPEYKAINPRPCCSPTRLRSSSSAFGKLCSRRSCMAFMLAW